jgi:hypothetical protein
MVWSGCWGQSLGRFNACGAPIRLLCPIRAAIDASPMQIDKRPPATKVFWPRCARAIDRKPACDASSETAHLTSISQPKSVRTTPGLAQT